jgi:cysteine dioxygenase
MTFADAIVEILRESAARPERATPANVCRVLAEETERHLDRIQFSAQRYMRHPIALWDDWEVMLIAWEKGQVTPVHDHRGVMGGMAVLTGSLVEERFETPGRKPELYETKTRPEGDLCDIGPTVLHRLAPVTSRSVSLHVYRPPLRTMGVWDESGMISIMPSAFDVGEEILARVDSGARKGVKTY